MTRLKPLSAIAMFIIFGANPARTEAIVWSEQTNIHPGTQFNDYFPQPAITPDGTVWVIWSGVDPLELDNEVFYSRWNGGSWDLPQSVNPANATEDHGPRISCAPNGVLWVLWDIPKGDGSAQYVGLASHWTGDSWSSPDTVWTDGTRHANRDFAAVDSTEAWFIREGSGGDVIVNHNVGASRDVEHRFDLPTATGYQPTIIVDGGGVVWAAWTHQETFPTPERLEFSRREMGTWAAPEVLPLPVEIKLPRLSVDRDNVKWIVCAGDDPTNPYKGDDIWALRWNGTGWSVPTRISEAIQSNDSLQVYNSVSRLPGEHPRAVWVRANINNYTRYDVLTTAWNGTTWSTVELVGALTDSSFVNWPDIAVRAQSIAVTWMREPVLAPFVFNVVAVRSLPPTTAAVTAAFSARSQPAGVLLSWSVESGSLVESGAIHRAAGRFVQPEPPGTTIRLMDISPDRLRAGTSIDRAIPEAGHYTYWLRLALRDGTSAWIEPRSVFHSQGPRRSRLTGALPNPSVGKVSLQGIREGDSPLEVRIYGVGGNLVRTIRIDQSQLQSQEGSSFSLEWDGRGERGTRQPNGVYLAQLISNTSRSPALTIKVLLLH